MDDKQLKLPQKTIVAIIAGFVLLFGTGLGIHLTYKPGIASVQQRIDDNTKRLDVFTKLYPTYNKLFALHQKQKEQNLISYSSTRVPERDISGFGDRIEKMCEQTGMDFISANPLPESIEADKQRILVDAVVRGEFGFFRDFLVKLLQVPSLVFIEQVQVRSIPEDREYALRLWVHFT